jgi:hypothetical protein
VQVRGIYIYIYRCLNRKKNMKEYKSSRFCSSVYNILKNCLQFNMEISVVDKSNIERKSLTTKTSSRSLSFMDAFLAHSYVNIATS